ncbi:MAG: hypothetical protein CMQ40_10830 [Gammaproteobacteria bacterium]|nr:hypothetical protein [Gammaproteobacteria bacterium]
MAWEFIIVALSIVLFGAVFFWFLDQFLKIAKKSVDEFEESIDKVRESLEKFREDFHDRGAGIEGNLDYLKEDSKRRLEVEVGRASLELAKLEEAPYWSRMLDSVQSLQSGVPTPAFSKPGDPARKIELSPGCKIHDAHVALAMIVSGRWSKEGVDSLVRATGYKTVQELEGSLLEAVEYQREKEIEECSKER